MDIELRNATSQLRLALLSMQHRHKRLVATTERKSRHYNRLQHTAAAVSLLEELLGMLLQDPDHWDDEPESVPF